MNEGPRFVVWMAHAVYASDTEVVTMYLLVTAIIALIAGICWLVYNVKK